MIFLPLLRRKLQMKRRCLSKGCTEESLVSGYCRKCLKGKIPNRTKALEYQNSESIPLSPDHKLWFKVRCCKCHKMLHFPSLNGYCLCCVTEMLREK